MNSFESNTTLVLMALAPSPQAFSSSVHDWAALEGSAGKSRNAAAISKTAAAAKATNF
jgi:hypothetical protein